MTLRTLCIVTLLAAFGCAGHAAETAPPPRKPKLILAVAIDQFRWEYLQRFRDGYNSGLKRVLEQGAVFEDAHYAHYPTVTAVGHSTFLSGAFPSVSGIVGNEWYDRKAHDMTTSVADPATKLVGADGVGSSPRKMLVSTVGDEIKMTGQESKVIGVSIKDRSAILPVGHMADGAYWFDNKSAKWVTSTYYAKALPEWVAKLNAAEPDAKSRNAVWTSLEGGKPLCTMGEATATLQQCRSLEASPWGNEMIEEFAERALEGEKLGRHAGTDILAVSFSSNDYVGHAMGPDSPEVRDISLRTDRLLGKLFDAVDKAVGLDRVLFVMTADHGVAPVPEVNTARQMIGGRFPTSPVATAINDALVAKYGPSLWVDRVAGSNIYLNWEAIEYLTKQRESSKTKEYAPLELSEMQRVAARAAAKVPGVFRAYSADQLQNGGVTTEAVDVAVRNGFYAQRAADVVIVQQPFYLFAESANPATETGTSHSTPFSYDTHVPVIFMGSGVKAGRYFEKVTVNDIAPTLSAILGITEPSGAMGRILREMWQ
jgi:hypothetical protein